MTTTTTPIVSYEARYTLQIAVELEVQAPEGASVEELDKLFFQKALNKSVADGEPDTIFFEMYDADGNEIADSLR